MKNSHCPWSIELSRWRVQGGYIIYATRSGKRTDGSLPSPVPGSRQWANGNLLWHGTEDASARAALSRVRAIVINGIPSGNRVEIESRDV